MIVQESGEDLETWTSLTEYKISSLMELGTSDSGKTLWCSYSPRPRLAGIKVSLHCCCVLRPEPYEAILPCAVLCGGYSYSAYVRCCHNIVHYKPSLTVEDHQVVCAGWKPAVATIKCSAIYVAVWFLSEYRIYIVCKFSFYFE